MSYKYYLNSISFFIFKLIKDNMNNCLKLISEIQSKSGIVEGLTLSFSSMVYIMIGSVIAGLGLLYDNYIVVLGSMCISPIGNSIIRYALGYTYGYSPFVSQGFKSLLTQMTIGTMIGYVMGHANKRLGEPLTPPTEEMDRRTNIDFFLTEFMLSFLCGLILAYSIIHNQIVPIVGLSLVVAVLPPIVNIGLYLSMAHNSENDEEYKDNLGKAFRTFILAFINITGLSISTILGFYIFCEMK